MLRKIVSYAGLAVGTSSFSLIGAGLYGVSFTMEHEVALVFLSLGVAYLLVGLALSRVEARGLSVGEGVLLTILVWLTVPALTSVALVITLGIPFIDAYFESVGGWTTTGLTIMSGEPSSWDGSYVPSVGELPETVKMWRSIMQWLGGLGIIVFTIALLARPGISAAVLYVAEGRYERLEASLKRSAYRLGILYTILTLIGVALIYAAGATLVDSIHFSMTAISTAGFTPYTESIARYLDYDWVLVTTLLVSFMGAMSFSDHDSILTLRLSRLRHSVELKAQLLILVLAVAATWLLYERDALLREVYTLRQALYDAVSAYTTVGFQSGPLGEASGDYKIWLIVLSAIGGSAFSTAGGIKVLRIAVALKVLVMEAETIVKPQGYAPRRRMGRYYVDERLVRRVMAGIAAFVFAYIILVVTAILLYPNMYKADDILFEMASAVFNIGLSTGITAASAPTGIKILLSVGMLLGRLEVIPFIVAARQVIYMARRS
ncbi:MAG: TrkH family potassium uptake protein [Desulfurococcales archaeon]|nr:TrkH family potassium uptake protein [Desulfurococcales archaeon]